MKIGDIEYTRTLRIGLSGANSSEFATINFALGIKVRPLLTRVGVFPLGADAVTGGQFVAFENGAAIAAGITLANLRADLRVHPIYSTDMALVTSGISQVVPFESTWWKILMPDVRVHGVSVNSAIGDYRVELHYRFAELTDDEIIEIAAQRSQG